MDFEKMSKKNKILIVDIETTGLNPKYDFIVEIGIVSLDVKTFEKKIIYDSVIFETGTTAEIYLTSWIVENGFMNLDDMRKYKRFEDEKEIIQEIINNYPLGVAAFNIAFDIGFLESRGIKFKNKIPCLMKSCTDICKIPKKNNPEKFKWPKAQEAFDYFFGKTDYIELHRGADDAFHEADIAIELIKRGILTFND